MMPAAAAELREMEWRCCECHSWRECRAWLRPELSSESHRFCPNADAIKRLRDPQIRRLASGPTEARFGVLAELNCGVGAELR